MLPFFTFSSSAASSSVISQIRGSFISASFKRYTSVTTRIHANKHIQSFLKVSYEHDAQLSYALNSLRHLFKTQK